MDCIPEEFGGLSSRSLHVLNGVSPAERFHQDMAVAAAVTSAASVQISEPYASSEEEEVMIDDEEYQLILSPFHACSANQPPLSRSDEPPSETRPVETPKFASVEDPEAEESSAPSGSPSPAYASLPTEQREADKLQQPSGDGPELSKNTPGVSPCVALPSRHVASAREGDSSGRVAAIASSQRATDAPESDEEDGNTYAVRIVITGPARWRGDLSFQGAPAMLCTIVRLRVSAEETEEREEQGTSPKLREEIVLQKRGWGPLVLEEVLVHARRLQQEKPEERNEEIEVLLLHFHRSVDEIPVPSDDQPFISPSSLTRAPLSVLQLPLSELDLGPTEAKYRLTLPPPAPFSPSSSFLLSPSFSLERLASDYRAALHNSTRGANRCNIILFSLKLLTLLTAPPTQQDQLYHLHAQQRMLFSAAACGGRSPALQASLSRSGSRSVALADQLKMAATHKALASERSPLLGRERQPGRRACASVVQGPSRSADRPTAPRSVACLPRACGALTAASPLFQSLVQSAPSAVPPDCAAPGSVVSAPVVPARVGPEAGAGEGQTETPETSGPKPEDTSAPEASQGLVGAAGLRLSEGDQDRNGSEGFSVQHGLVMACRPVSAPSTRLVASADRPTGEKARGNGDKILSREVSLKCGREGGGLGKISSAQSDAGVDRYLFLAGEAARRTRMARDSSGLPLSSRIYAETAQRKPAFLATSCGEKGLSSLQTMRLHQSFAHVKGTHFRPPASVSIDDGVREGEVEDISPDDSVSVREGGRGRRQDCESEEDLEASGRREAAPDQPPVRLHTHARGRGGGNADGEGCAATLQSTFHRRQNGDMREAWSSDGDGETNSYCGSAGTLRSDSHSRKTTLTSSIQRMNFLMNQAQLLLQRRQMKHQQRALARQREEQRAARNGSCDKGCGTEEQEANQAGRETGTLKETASEDVARSQLAAPAARLTGDHINATSLSESAQEAASARKAVDETHQAPLVSKQRSDSLERLGDQQTRNHAPQSSRASPSTEASPSLPEASPGSRPSLPCAFESSPQEQPKEDAGKEVKRPASAPSTPETHEDVITTTGSAACIDDGPSGVPVKGLSVSLSVECEGETAGELAEGRAAEILEPDTFGCAQKTTDDEAHPATELVLASNAGKEDFAFSAACSLSPERSEAACCAPAFGPSLLSDPAAAPSDVSLCFPPSFSPLPAHALLSGEAPVCAASAPSPAPVLSVGCPASLQRSEDTKGGDGPENLALTKDEARGDEKPQLHEDELRAVVDQLRGYMVRIEHRLSKRLSKKKKLGKRGEKAARKGDSSLGLPEQEGPNGDRKRAREGEDTSEAGVSKDAAILPEGCEEERGKIEDPRCSEAFVQRALAMRDFSYLAEAVLEKRAREKDGGDEHWSRARKTVEPAGTLEALAEKAREDQTALERLEAECLSARTAIASLKADLARTTEEKDALRKESEKKEEERVRKEQALEQRKRELEDAFEKERAALEERLRRGVEAERAKRRQETEGKAQEKREAHDDSAEKEKLRQHAQTLAAAYGALARKVELEEALRGQAMKKKEEEMRNLLDHLKQQEARLRQREEENAQLHAQLQALRTHAQKSEDERQRNLDTPPQARETEALRRQLQDATQELTRQQQKIRLLEDQQRSVAVCASSSSLASSSPSYPGGVDASAPLEQVEKLQRELALAEKDRLRLLTLDKQREKERLHLVDLFSLQCMRVRDLEQQLLQIDEQLATILSQSTRASASALLFTHAASPSSSGASQSAALPAGAERTRDAAARTGNAEGRKTAEPERERKRASSVAPAAVWDQKEREESVTLRPSVLQRLRGMRESIRHMHEQRSPVLSSLGHQSLAGLSKPLGHGQKEERETRSEVGFTGTPSLLRSREKAESASPASLSLCHPSGRGGTLQVPARPGAVTARGSKDRAGSAKLQDPESSTAHFVVSRVETSTRSPAERSFVPSAARPSLSRSSVSTSQTVHVGRPTPRSCSPTTRQLSASSHVLSPGPVCGAEQQVLSASYTAPSGGAPSSTQFVGSVGRPVSPWASGGWSKDGSRAERVSGMGNLGGEDEGRRGRIRGGAPHVRSSSVQSTPGSLHRPAARPSLSFVPCFVAQNPPVGTVSVAPSGYSLASSLAGVRGTDPRRAPAAPSTHRDVGGREESRLARSLYRPQMHEAAVDWRGKGGDRKAPSGSGEPTECGPAVYRYATPTRVARRLPAGEEQPRSAALRFGTPARQGTLGTWIQENLRR
ncbi:conserved hypothetical protein [Neospora caninum Liverpool]|uniref:Uncharacterized protein n=1 Tax=Neospora caninum (strain Liverpool) TaxID=572307 RepID=F0VBK5_NEOCL|nr:conserved hypothetical protein [Neospora caninum Liverpool]CBZ50989.1 conserved hypothetical protein [Neospora caninum Liverpool]CEL68292.1 TPA: hypothetical protein BN1204_040630 [Neospora caninum Liverpool]|eukprot:XP_003881022.1 conserved hypothetical protein [Neospora caninum Liverpool]